jgi:hypothetical protein
MFGSFIPIIPDPATGAAGWRKKTWNPPVPSWIVLFGRYSLHSLAIRKEVLSISRAAAPNEPNGKTRGSDVLGYITSWRARRICEMGTIIRLRDAIGKLASLDQDATIYAAEPWTAESSAIVAIEPDSGGIPEDASRLGLRYFLEVSEARDFLEGWESTLGRSPTEQERWDRLIRYVIDDG